MHNYAGAVDLLRLGIIVAVVGLLAVRARWAWQQRALAVRVWRSIRPRHVAGALGLLVVVAAVSVTLFLGVPATRIGLGTLVGLDGNAVFAPIDTALEAPIVQAEQAATTGQPAPGVPWTDVALVTGFLGLLVALFPVLAHAEEVAFRAGWEDKGPGQQVLSALRFGLVHLIMLIPIAAALAIAVAGYAYGRLYLRAYRRAAVPRLVWPGGRLPLAVDEQGLGRLVMGPPAPVLQVDRAAARREGVMAATVWHATFNTTVAVVVLLGYLLSI